MLRQLYIKNFALIDELTMTFDEGFSVITGETGAGKSIILGAMNLLLGQRADMKQVKSGSDKCIVEAHFDLSHYNLEPFFNDNDIDYDAHDTIIHREITTAGKSRAYINDQPVQLALLKELGEQLVDIHSQHQNLLLREHDFQLGVVDTIADNEVFLSEYAKAYNEYILRSREARRMEAEIESNRKNADFITFQFEELDKAALNSGEQNDLEQRQELLSHAEEVKGALFEATGAMQDDIRGAVVNLRRAVDALTPIYQILPNGEDTITRLNGCLIEMKDLAHDIEMQLERADFDPKELDAINDRLDRLYSLEQKYNVKGEEELIARRDFIARQLSQMENSDDALAECRQKAEEARKECLGKAVLLHKRRLKAGKDIESEMTHRLKDLGMPNVTFQTDISSGEMTTTGTDKAAMLFSANSGTPLMPVAKAASGGEIARVMLSLKAMISKKVKMPTIIFDEIDTGVSGKIAEIMGHIMREMGQDGRQVISITHLPQIAAQGALHYKVYKEESTKGSLTHMTLLTDEERITEIAQMLSGTNISPAAINNAKTLLRLI